MVGSSVQLVLVWISLEDDSRLRKVMRQAIREIAHVFFPFLFVLLDEGTMPRSSGI